MQSEDYLMLRSAQRARLEARTAALRSSFRASDNFLTASFADMTTRGGLSRADSALELAAAIGLVEAFGIRGRGFLPRVAAAAQGAGEVRRAFFVEGAAALLAVDRRLDQEGIDQVLHMPSLI